MNIVFARQQATVHQICEQLDGAPTPMAVRRLLAILMEKGHLNRKKQGREYVYLAKQSKSRAGGNALRQVLETFFDGSMGSALASHLERPGTRLTDEEIERLGQLIDDLRKEGFDNE